MDSITVTTDDLRTWSTDVKNKAAEYKTLYDKLFSWVETFTNTDWKGEDADAFRNQVNGFKDDFDKMKQLMDDYGQHLDKAATTYDTQTSNVKGQASSLQN